MTIIFTVIKDKTEIDSNTNLYSKDLTSVISSSSPLLNP